MAGDFEQVPSDAQGRFTLKAPVERVRVTCEPAETDPQLHAETGGDYDAVAGQPCAVALVAARWSAPPSEPGFRMQRVTLPPTVTVVTAGGPAASSGIAVGDQILAVDRRPVATLLSQTVAALITAHASGTVTVLEFAHTGTTRQVRLVLAPARVTPTARES